MSVLGKKLSRARRMQAMDENQFDALAAELAAIESLLSEHLKRVEQIQGRLNTAISSTPQNTIAMHQQTLAYTQNLQAEIEQSQAKTAEIEQLRDETMSRVIEQKIKVKGSETLVEKLRFRLNEEYTKAEAVVADDRHMSQFNSGENT